MFTAKLYYGELQKILRVTYNRKITKSFEYVSFEHKVFAFSAMIYLISNIDKELLEKVIF